MYIRTRLALWAILIVFFVLIVFSVSTRIFLGITLRNTTTASLEQHALADVTFLNQSPAETISSLREKLNALATPEFFLQAQDRSGHVLASSANMGKIVLPLQQIQQMIQHNQEVHIVTGGTTFLVNVEPMLLAAHTWGYLLVARPNSSNEIGLVLLQNLLYPEVLIALGIAALLVWLLVRHELHPLERLAIAASEIATARDHSLRLHPQGPPNEINSLARTINGMLHSLDEAYQRLQKANDLQRSFLADVSHELRTPLTIILSSLDLLKKEAGSDPDFQASALESIRVESQRMARMVTQLLILARTAESATIEREPLLFADLVSDVLEVCQQGDLAQGRGKATLVVTGLERLEDAVVAGNADYLKQVLFILLDNALKYTPATGLVTITAELFAATLTISVADTGIGIPPEDQAHIFERFYRAENVRDRPGMGLGLSIAQRIVEQHSGQICIKSDPGYGSCFTIILPLFAAQGQIVRKQAGHSHK